MSFKLPQPAPGDLCPGWTYRGLDVRDAAAVLEAFRSAPDMARQGAVENMETAQAYVQARTDHTQGVTLVAVDAQDRARALAAASYYSPENRCAWVYYWAHAGARGQGVTSALVRVLSNWMIDECAVERLELGYRVNNPASGAVAAKAGFIVEGVERGKFLIDGQRIDAAIAARLHTDPRPADR